MDMHNNVPSNSMQMIITVFAKTFLCIFCVYDEKKLTKNIWSWYMFNIYKYILSLYQEWHRKENGKEQRVDFSNPNCNSNQSFPSSSILRHQIREDPVYCNGLPGKYQTGYYHDMSMIA